MNPLLSALNLTPISIALGSGSTGPGVVDRLQMLHGQLVPPGAVTVTVMPADGVLVTLLAALILSQIAAIFPALRAARIRILEAVHYE